MYLAIELRIKNFTKFSLEVLWIFVGLGFLFRFFYNFLWFFKMLTNLVDWICWGQTLDNSTNFILNGGFNPYSNSLILFFGLCILPLSFWPLFILCNSNLILLLFSSSIPFKISKFLNHQILTLLKLHFLTSPPFLVDHSSTMAPKLSSKHKGNKRIQ